MSLRAYSFHPPCLFILLCPGPIIASSVLHGFSPGSETIVLPSYLFSFVLYIAYSLLKGSSEPVPALQNFLCPVS